MALLAGSRNVGTGQWEIGLVVIEARVPIGGGVAGLAGCRESSGDVIGIVGIVVIRLVTRKTFRWCTGKLAVDVTLLTIS